eukprot:403348464
MFSKGNEFYTTGGIAEDQMKINAVRFESEELYEKDLYKEAAKRVVFHNCMAVCDLTHENLNYFNSAFYYERYTEQACLQNCQNTRMKLHFGKAAESENLLLDFQKLKNQYQRYETWNPQNQAVKKIVSTPTEDKVQRIAHDLLEKSKQSRYGKYDF